MTTHPLPAEPPSPNIDPGMETPYNPGDPQFLNPYRDAWCLFQNALRRGEKAGFREPGRSALKMREDRKRRKTVFATRRSRVLKQTLGFRFLSGSILSLTGMLAGFSASANALTYKIHIKQNHAVSDTYVRICNDAAPSCDIPLQITQDNGKKENIQAQISFKPGGLDFRFERAGQYLSPSSLDNDSFYMPVGNAKNQTREIALYIPHPLTQSDSAGSLYRHPIQRMAARKIATLQVTVTAESPEKKSIENRPPL